MEFTSDIIFKDKKIRKICDYFHEKHKIFENNVEVCVLAAALGYGLGYITSDSSDEDCIPVNLPRSVINRGYNNEKIMFILQSHFLQEKNIPIKERLQLSFSNSEEYTSRRTEILKGYINTGAHYIYEKIEDFDNPSECMDTLHEICEEILNTVRYKVANEDLKDELL